MAKAEVLLNKVVKHDTVLKVERDFSTEYFIGERDTAYDNKFYSLVINSGDKVSDYGETEENIVARVCQECADGKKEYEYVPIKEFYEKIGEKLFKGDTDFEHKF